MMFDSSSRWILVGLTSYGDPCPSTRYSGVYTRITTFQDWMNSVMNSGVTMAPWSSVTFGMITLVVALRSWGSLGVHF